jgi:hypothetical protein
MQMTAASGSMHSHHPFATGPPFDNEFRYDPAATKNVWTTFV